MEFFNVTSSTLKATRNSGEETEGLQKQPQYAHRQESTRPRPARLRRLGPLLLRRGATLRLWTDPEVFLVHQRAEEPTASERVEHGHVDKGNRTAPRLSAALQQRRGAVRAREEVDRGSARPEGGGQLRLRPLLLDAGAAEEVKTETEWTVCRDKYSSRSEEVHGDDTSKEITRGSSGEDSQKCLWSWECSRFLAYSWTLWLTKILGLGLCRFQVLHRSTAAKKTRRCLANCKD
uniref:Uncharacterized protein n=1 Tax=Steinernema glaseri TaxID=37863 RepID=A0A1I7Y4P3_9BILA